MGYDAFRRPLGCSCLGLLLLSGCGQSTDSSAVATPPFVASKAESTPTSTVSNVTVALNAGWNAVGLQSAQLTALSASPGLAGAATFNGSTYVSTNFSLADVNAGAGGRRGFWVFATTATSFTYSGTDSPPNFVDLTNNGYNLVSFCTSVDLPGASVTASQNGQTVPLSSVVAPQFTEIGPNNVYTTVDVTAGGVLKAGRAYWVVANTSNGAVRLNLPGAASPSPSPSGQVLGLAVVPGVVSTNVGVSLPLKATATIVGAGQVDVTNQVTWTTGAANLASVSPAGVLTGQGIGTTTATATLGGRSATAVVEVGPPLTSGGGVPTASPSPASDRDLAVNAGFGSTGLRRVSPAGVVTNLYGGSIASAPDSGLSYCNSAGTLFYPRITGATCQIRCINATSDALFANLPNSSNPQAVTAGPTGDLFVTVRDSTGLGASGGVKRISVPGAAVTDFFTGLVNPRGIVVDGSGNVYVALRTGGALEALTAGGAIMTGFGTAGIATVPGTNSLQDLKRDSAGRLYTCDSVTNRVYRCEANGTGVTNPNNYVSPSTPVALLFDNQDRLYIGTFTGEIYRQPVDLTGPNAAFANTGVTAAGLNFLP